MELPHGVGRWNRHQFADLRQGTTAQYVKAAEADTLIAYGSTLAEHVVNEVTALHRRIAYEAADDPALAMSLAEIERTFSTSCAAVVRGYLAGW
jgi:hypothetical protein